MRIERSKKWRKSAAKVQKNVWLLKASRLMIVRPCLFDGETIYREQILIENKKHKVYTLNEHKIGLNREDDKRLVQTDGITTLARGHVWWPRGAMVKFKSKKLKK